MAVNQKSRCYYCSVASQQRLVDLSVVASHYIPKQEIYFYFQLVRLGFVASEIRLKQTKQKKNHNVMDLLFPLLVQSKLSEHRSPLTLSNKTGKTQKCARKTGKTAKAEAPLIKTKKEFTIQSLLQSFLWF